MTNSTLKMRSLVSLAFFGSLAHGHMRMATPKTWGQVSDRAPITANNFPCGSTGDASFYSGVDTVQMAVGATQKITFDGTAPHHGGSCQFAVTADSPPTKTSAWQVILSIQGGCPTKDNGATGSEYDVVIPDGIAPGKYTFAWTWIPYQSGGPEFYMNCSPIEVTGGKAKRSHNDDDYDDYNATALAARAAAFPNLNVINLAGINDCMVDAMGAHDTIWPDPGPNLQKLATYTPLYQEIKAGTPPCAPGGSSSGSSSGGSSGGGAAAAAASPSTAAAAGGSGGGDGFKTEIKSATTAAAATSPAAAAASPSYVVT